MEYNPISVTELNRYIKGKVDNDEFLNNVLVKGEISNFKHHYTGHLYFTLKDEGSLIKCVMFKTYTPNLKFVPRDGMNVMIFGTVSVFERDGVYQIYCKAMQEDGMGSLYTAYEELKKKLAESGMFAEEYKQPIPAYIKTLGVVTASTGAAVRDIINVATRRNPHIQIILYPAIVQGDQAAESIVRGIETLSEMQTDVIIVGRGGGSIEDLWAFNEEIVAEAIFNCPVPIISAVGHETDTTIADYVADRRAPTPSAAAEIAVFEYRRFVQDLEDYSYTLQKSMNRVIGTLKLKEAKYSDSLKHLSPAGRIKEKLLRMDRLQDTIQTLMDRKIMEARNRLLVDTQKLKGLSPLERLMGGYSFTTDENGKNVRSIEQVNKGDELSIYVTDGVIKATATETMFIDRK